MSSDKRRILNLLADGKISADEAERLLSALNGRNSENEVEEINTVKKKIPKYFYVKVDDKGGDKVDIKIPLALAKSGIKFASIIPKDAKCKINQTMHEKGLDFDINNMSSKDVDEFIQTLSDFEINVNDSSGDKVRIYCGE